MTQWKKPLAESTLRPGDASVTNTNPLKNQTNNAVPLASEIEIHYKDSDLDVETYRHVRHIVGASGEGHRDLRMEETTGEKRLIIIDLDEVRKVVVTASELEV